ncbi:MAG: SOS response-associated peptidase family protein, partial [Galactobacter sp.]
MCGRYVVARAAGDLMDEFGAEDGQEETLLRPNFNVAPTTDVPVVLERLDEEGSLLRELHVARWGLLPPWAKDASF